MRSISRSKTFNCAEISRNLWRSYIRHFWKTKISSWQMRKDLARRRLLFPSCIFFLRWSRFKVHSLLWHHKKSFQNGRHLPIISLRCDVWSTTIQTIWMDFLILRSLPSHTNPVAKITKSRILCPSINLTCSSYHQSLCRSKSNSSRKSHSFKSLLSRPTRNHISVASTDFHARESFCPLIIRCKGRHTIFTSSSRPSIPR